MSKLLKWFAIAAATLTIVAGLALAGVFIASQVMLDRPYAKTPDTIAVMRTREAIAEGQHLVTVIGCADCHGTGLTGGKIDVPGSTVYGPNLTLLGNLSDADIDRILRFSQMPDGKSVVVMPTRTFASLTASERASIIAYLRSLKPHGTSTPDLSFGLMVRAGLIAGVFDTEMTALAKSKPPLELGPRYARGRHFAQVICAGCHGTDVAGQPNDPILPTPDLIIVAAYTRDQFRTLMHTGKALGGRDAGEMSRVARLYFTGLSDTEIDAIYDYLAARAKKLIAQPGKSGLNK